MSLESNFEFVLLSPAVRYHFRQWYDPPPPRSPSVPHSGRLNIPESTPTDITSSEFLRPSPHTTSVETPSVDNFFELFTQKQGSPD